MIATQNYIGTVKDRITVSCGNDCSLLYDSTLELLVEMKSGVAGSWKWHHDKFLSISELISLANPLKDSTAVSKKELALHIPSRLQPEKFVCNIITQLVAHLTLMLLTRPESCYIINIHQIGFDCKEVDLFFKNRADNKAIPGTKQPTEKNESG